MSHTLKFSVGMRLTFLQTTDRPILLMSEVCAMYHIGLFNKKCHITSTLHAYVWRWRRWWWSYRPGDRAWLRFNISKHDTVFVETKT